MGRKREESKKQAEPQSAHAQAVDPALQPTQFAGLAPESNPHSTGHSATASPDGAKTNLEDVLPEIARLAQRVGGLERLTEIIASLRQSQE